MNIFNKITLRSLKKNRTRTIVTIIGVILSVALITAITSFIASMQHFLVQDELAQSGNWHIAFNDVDTDFIAEVYADRRVANVAIVQSVSAKLPGEESDFELKRFDQTAFDMLPLDLINGRLPQNSNEIIVSSRLNATIGELLTVEVGYWVSDGYCTYEGLAWRFIETGTESFTVVGIVEQLPWEQITIRTLLNASDGLYSVRVELRNPRNVLGFAERIGHQYHELNHNLLRMMGISTGGAMFETLLGVMLALGAILIALVMLGSISLIHNAFAISVSERTRQFGILSSVGATSKQLRRSVLFEGMFVGSIGIPLGILLGLGGIGITLKIVRDIFEQFASGRVSLYLSPSIIAIVAAIAIGAITILISAYIPAKRASKKSAIDTIRQSGDVKISAKSMKTSKITMILFGLEGELAAKNFKRNKKRYRATVFSLVISVVLFISASAFGVYLNMSGQRVFMMSDYDVAVFFTDESRITTDEIIELYAQLRDVDYITESQYQFHKNFSAWVDSDMLSDQWLDDRFRWDERNDPIPDVDEIFPQVIFINDERYAQYLSEINFNGDGFPAVAQMRRFNGYTNRFETIDVLRSVSDIELTLYAQADWERYGNNMSVTVTVVDVVPSLILRSDGVIIIAPYSQIAYFDFLEDNELSGSIAFSSDNPHETASQVQKLLDASNITQDYRVINAFASEEENRRIILVMNIFIYGFIIMISLITIANVFNTISTSIKLRRREFAMLRSIGMTERGFNRMMNFECLFYGLKALLFGLPISLGVTYFIYRAVISGIDAPFVLPWAGIGIAVFSVFFVVFITMLYSVRKLKNVNVIDALRSDMA